MSGSQEGRDVRPPPSCLTLHMRRQGRFGKVAAWGGGWGGWCQHPPGAGKVPAVKMRWRRCCNGEAGSQTQKERVTLGVHRPG